MLQHSLKSLVIDGHDFMLSCLHVAYVTIRKENITLQEKIFIFATFRKEAIITLENTSFYYFKKIGNCIRTFEGSNLKNV